MGDLGRILITAGVILVVAGGILLVVARTGLSRLPGDLSFTIGQVRVFIPLMTSLLLSILLTVIVWWLRR